jgi:hypothetical protein
LAFAFAYSFLSHEEGFTISASPDGTRFLRRAAVTVEGEPGGCQIPRSTEGTAALRNLLEFPNSERVPVRREPERLVSILCGEGKRALTLAQKPRKNSSSFAECINLAF